MPLPGAFSLFTKLVTLPPQLLAPAGTKEVTVRDLMIFELFALLLPAGREDRPSGVAPVGLTFAGVPLEALLSTLLKGLVAGLVISTV